MALLKIWRWTLRGDSVHELIVFRKNYPDWKKIEPIFKRIQRTRKTLNKKAGPISILEIDKDHRVWKITQVKNRSQTFDVILLN